MTTLQTFNISGSEGLALAKCETLWMYQFHPEYNLEPKRSNDAISRGVMGHKGLEIFFKELQKGVDFDVAVEACMMQINKFGLEAMLKGDGTTVGLVQELKTILPEYFADNKAEILTWEILGVEMQLEMVYAHPEGLGDVKFVGTIDLLIKPRSGPHKGEVIPVDHKFKYNFFTDADLEMEAQITGYVALVRQNFPGSVCKRGYFNQIRYRSVKTADKNKIHPHRVTKNEIDGIIANHMLLAAKAAYYRSMKVESVRRAATRTVSSWTCGRCSMRSLCKTELIGQDNSRIIAGEYQTRTYGYDDPTEDD